MVTRRFAERTAQIQRIAHWKADFWTHVIGIPLALVGMAALVARGTESGAPAKNVILSVGFCVSFLLLYTISSLYHRSFRHLREDRILRWNRLDRSGIFFAVAMSATAHAWVVPDFSYRVAVGTTCFAWLIAIGGICYEMVRPPRETLKSTPLYFVMVAPLVMVMLKHWPDRHLWSASMFWILGGVSMYLAGAMVFALDTIQDEARQAAKIAGEKAPLTIRFTHSIWHLIVVLGSAMHYYALWLQL